MIKITNLVKKFQNRLALKCLNYTFPRNGLCIIYGPSGSGKTTLIKAVCGFHFPTEGSITITAPNGSPNSTIFTTEENPELCMEYIGYVPEIPLLPKDMRVGEFLRYAAETHGISKDKITDACDTVIKECTLENFLNKKIRTLSKGQQQRVSFAQAIIHNPPNLILDEPISGLDPAQIIQMRDLIKKLSKTKAILMSTHILQEVRSLYSDIFIMSAGQITAHGSEEEISKAQPCT